MAFNFNGGKKDNSFDSFTFDDSTKKDSGDGGNSSGFSFGKFKPKELTSTDLLDNFNEDNLGVGGLGRSRRKKGIDLSSVSPKIWIIGIMVIVCIILVAVFIEEILAFMSSLMMLIIVIGLGMLAIRLLFGGGRRRR